MGPEAGILDCNKGVDQILGQFFVCGFFPVCTGHNQGVCQISLAVIDLCGKAAGAETCRIHIGSAVNNSADYTGTDSGSGQRQKKHNNEKQLKQIQKQAAAVLASVGTGALELAPGGGHPVII